MTVPDSGSDSKGSGEPGSEGGGSGEPGSEGGGSGEPGSESVETTTGTTPKTKTTATPTPHPKDRSCNSILDDIPGIDSMVNMFRSDYPMETKVLKAKKRFFGLCWKGNGWGYPG